MIIKMFPVGSTETLALARRGDCLIINFVEFDFSRVSEGATLPGSAVGSPWVLGPVERESGTLKITINLPHADDAPRSARFPSDIYEPPDGTIALPGQDAVDQSAVSPGVIDWAQLITAEMKAEQAAAEALASIQVETARLRSFADAAIAPLQDAIDLEEATAEEVAALKEWKRYRVALNRLPEDAGYPDEIDWPAPPT